MKRHPGTDHGGRRRSAQKPVSLDEEGARAVARGRQRRGAARISATDDEDIVALHARNFSDVRRAKPAASRRSSPKVGNGAAKGGVTFVEDGLMRSVLTLALGLSLATASFGISDASHDSATTVTRVAQRLQGTWDCRGPVLGSTSREVYARGGPNTIALRNAVHTARGLSGIVDETFGYDPATATWELSAPMNRFFDVMQLGAQDWRTAQWVFTGTQTVQNVARPVRIVYTSLGPDAYRREHQSLVGSGWQGDGAFACRRLPAVAAHFVPAIGVVRSTAVPVHRVAAARTAAPTRAPAHTHAAAARVALGMQAPRTARLADDKASSLIGAWSCRTFGGADATHTFTRKNDGTLMLHNVLHIGERDYHIDETYRFNRSNKTWSNVTEGGAYLGTAPRWLGSTWVFDGSVAQRGVRVPVKMSYAVLGAHAFRRRFERLHNGVWATYAGETCER